MVRFAYRVVDLSALGRRQSLEALLNTMGTSGWQLVTVVPPNLGIFSRRLDQARSLDAPTEAETVKYRDPKTGATWAGRGRMPLWLANRLREGARREDFKV